MLLEIRIGKRAPGSRGLVPRYLQLRCDRCNVEFEYPYSKGKIELTYHFCSRKCSQAARSKDGVLRPIMEETMRRKMGNDWASQIGRKANDVLTVEERKARGQKAKQTVVERYGANSACQIPHVRESCLAKSHKPEAIAKRKATTFERFGVESMLSLPEVHRLANTPEACLKRHKTMVKNGSYFSSRPEERCYELLCERFGSDDIERQAWVNRWPIDFYVKSIDTYVQEDGVYLHGLDRPIEIIAEHRTEKDRQIHEKWLTDQRQNEWFMKSGKRLIRITDKQVGQGNVMFSKHTLSHCTLCETDMVLCGTCGNNSCNGTYGPGPDGELTKCPDCPEAYDHQAAFFQDTASVRFAKDVRPLGGQSGPS